MEEGGGEVGQLRKKEVLCTYRVLQQHQHPLCTLLLTKLIKSNESYNITIILAI